MEYILMIIGAVLVNNIVLVQFLGICPFLGVSNKVNTALGMGMAVIFVMTLATLVTATLQKYILMPLGITYLQTIVFILVIAALVQMVEIVLKKVSPPLYQALGVFLPLITTNCAVLGVAIKVTEQELITGHGFSILDSTIYAIAVAIGFTLAIVIFAGLREQLELVEIPKGMKGVPIALITAGILAMAFMGFSNLV
jgi:electron transport complex, RnfABCDGE type, A subunit